MRTNFCFVPVCVIALASVGLQAHGIWFAQRSGELALVYGEGGEDGPIVNRADRVKRLDAFDENGAPVKTRLISTDRLLLVDVEDKPAVIAAIFDNGFWTTLADNTEVNTGKRGLAKVKDSGRYYKYAVHLRRDLKKPLGALPGQVLQLTPVSAALPQKMGDAITLRALFDGKPLANAKVVADFVNDPTATPMRTAGDGTVTVRVRNQGLNVISIVHETPSAEPAEADLVQHRATLSFVLSFGG